MSSRPAPLPRTAFRHFRATPTRWMDNDVYGHVNNVTYYSYFDTIVNAFLIEQGALDIVQSPVIGLVVETQCNYFRPLSFPETLDGGLRVTRQGTSSVRYEIGIFRAGEESASAQGHFVHVYVERASGRPAPLPEALRRALAQLATAN